MNSMYPHKVWDNGTAYDKLTMVCPYTTDHCRSVYCYHNKPHQCLDTCSIDMLDRDPIPAHVKCGRCIPVRHQRKAKLEKIDRAAQ